MKRKVSKVLSVLLIAALMLSFTAVASAETRMYATSAVNVRSGPGTNYSIVNVLEAGGAYTIIEEQNGWGLLKGYKNNRDGWIYLIYTRKI